MHLHRDLEQELTAFLADAMAKMHQIARITRHAPLKAGLPAEILVIRIAHPPGHHRLIAQVVQAFEQEQPHH
jgi:hypothetical protein